MSLDSRPLSPQLLPQCVPTTRELDDLELLRMGALDPITGFGPLGSRVSLVVAESLAIEAVNAPGLELVDPEGVPLATLTVEGTYHHSDGHVGLIGPIQPLPGTIVRVFNDLYVSPAQAGLDSSALVVPVVAPLTVTDLAVVGDRAAGNPVAFVVLTGHGTPVGVSALGLIRATLAAAAALGATARPRIIAVPVAARINGADDQEFRRRVVAAYAGQREVWWPMGGGELAPAVQAAVDQDRPSGVGQGLVVFFTGLSGSGKSTLAQALRNVVLEQGLRTVSLLDGDRVRRNLSAGLTFSPADRETNITRIGWVAAEISRHGGMAICSPIAPYDHSRQLVRSMVADAGSAFVLVHVATPLEECERRDRKGLYAKARRGELDSFTGISSPYEVPADADLHIDTTGRDVAGVLAQILGFLTARGHLDADRTDMHTGGAPS